MTDTTIVDFRKSASLPTYRKYSGYILEVIEKRIAPNQYTITDVIIRTVNGTRHRFTVSLKVGICLYLFIHTGRRVDRMSDILFKFTVETDSQKIIESLAYDSAEWIGDALKRDGKLPKPPQ